MKSVAILLSADSFEKFFGGFFGITAEDYVERYRNDFAWYYAAALSKLGHRVSIYVLSREREFAVPTPDGLAVRFLKLPRWWLLLDPLLYRLARRGLLARLRARIEGAAFGPALRAGLEADRIDVLYVQEIWPDRIDFLRPPKGVELIGADHGAPARAPGPAKRRALRRLRKITVQERGQLQQIEAAGAHAILIPNGVDTAFFTPPPSADARAKSVLSIGRLDDRQKRLSDLISAMVDLPDFRLDVVGAGPDRDRLTEQVRQLRLEGRVTFHGFVSDRERLRELYRECGVFCCPSAWEATLLVLLEAMSCGAACVSSDIPTLREALADGSGLIVPVGSPSRLSAAIDEAYRRRAELGSAARQRAVTHFDQEACMQRLSDYIES